MKHGADCSEEKVSKVGGPYTDWARLRRGPLFLSFPHLKHTRAFPVEITIVFVVARRSARRIREPR